MLDVRVPIAVIMKIVGAVIIKLRMRICPAYQRSTVDETITNVTSKPNLMLVIWVLEATHNTAGTVMQELDGAGQLSRNTSTGIASSTTLHAAGSTCRQHISKRIVPMIGKRCLASPTSQSTQVSSMHMSTVTCRGQTLFVELYDA